MKSKSIPVGARFGKWLVIGPHITEKRGEGRLANYVTFYPCRCDCGAERPVRAFKLLGNSRSCGCEKVSAFVERNTVHGMNARGDRHPLYTTWDGMQQRCTNPAHSSFHRYGGRGIVIEWQDFRSFADWAMKNGWRHGLQVDRKDNDGPYSAANCRIVTDAANKRNKAANVMLTAFGETKCLTDWALDPRCSVTPSTIATRIDGGATPDQAITALRKTRLGARRFEAHHEAS